MLSLSSIILIKAVLKILQGENVKQSLRLELVSEYQLVFRYLDFEQGASELTFHVSVVCHRG